MIGINLNYKIRKGQDLENRENVLKPRSGKMIERKLRRNKRRLKKRELRKPKF